MLNYAMIIGVSFRDKLKKQARKFKTTNKITKKIIL